MKRDTQFIKKKVFSEISYEYVKILRAKFECKVSDYKLFQKRSSRGTIAKDERPFDTIITYLRRITNLHITTSDLTVMNKLPRRSGRGRH